MNNSRFLAGYMRSFLQNMYVQSGLSFADSKYGTSAIAGNLTDTVQHIQGVRRCIFLHERAGYDSRKRVDMKRKIFILTCFLTTLIVTGCVALLPRSSLVTNSPWKTYNEVVTAYDSVVPSRSTVSDMKKLGFDIYSTPNLKILSYVDIAVATQSLKKGELSSGTEACLKVQTLCTGYAFEPQVVRNHRYGNFWLDTFNFNRKIKETGWRFKASFLIIDNVVVDKYWSGEPQVDHDKEIVNPLGPLQEVGNIISGSRYNPL